MCTHTASAWHPIAISEENLHRDGILVPVDLFLMFPVLHCHQMGLPALALLEEKNENQELYSIGGFKVKKPQENE